MKSLLAVLVLATAMGGSQLGENLTDEETDQIVAFLESLTGSMPEIVYPVLPPETAATPRPTADIK